VPELAARRSRRLSRPDRAPRLRDNDVNVLALGEWMFGAGQGARFLVVLAIGTGVAAASSRTGGSCAGRRLGGGSVTCRSTSTAAPASAAGRAAKTYVSGTDIAHGHGASQGNVSAADVFRMADESSPTCRTWSPRYAALGAGLAVIVTASTRSA
jgi:glucokinase